MGGVRVVSVVSGWCHFGGALCPTIDCQTDGMLLTASSAALKAKLTEKSRWRPTKMVRRKMPDGHEQLANLPTLRVGAAPGDPDAVAEYSAAVDKVSAVFGAQRRATTTAAEHRMYTRMFEGWLVASNFGSYFEVLYGDDGVVNDVADIKVIARRDASGKIKVRAPPYVGTCCCARAACPCDRAACPCDRACERG